MTKFIEHFYGREGVHETCYMTRVKLSPTIFGGELFLHIFHRGDADPDPHDHPWPFITLPLVDYKEEVLGLDGRMQTQTVRAWRLHYRPATHIHRVLGRSHGPKGRVVSLFWHFRKTREWGFWAIDVDRSIRFRNMFHGNLITKRQLRGLCIKTSVFVPWRDYIYGCK